MNDVIFAGLDALTPNAPEHRHAHWELLCCTQGTGCFVFEDLETSYHAGDVIVIPPGTPHAHVNLCGAACIYLYIVNATLSLRAPMVLRDDENHSLLHLFADVHYLFLHGQDVHGSLLPAYGHLITQHISVHRAMSPRNLLVEDIAQSILQNYPNADFDLDSVLRSAPYCYDYLCRLFRQEMHTTPHKYLANLRLKTAADILQLDTGKSITEIARMCGYQDPLYFSRMFKKKYALSPREYARQHRQAEDLTE